MKYTELVGMVGYSTTTSRCLKALEAQRAVEKRVMNEPYRPVEYRFTEKGWRLYDLAAQIEKLSVG
ncbi:MAG: winged helix-turn-helix transcriptional regulator [Conexivisphaerales archaeon]|jgi:DNA-binding HxlR family transcriptional regulator